MVIFQKKKVKKFYDDWIKKAIKGLFDDECILGVYKSKIVGFCCTNLDMKTNLEEQTLVYFL